MKRLIAIAMLAGILAGVCRGDSPVVPDSVTFTNTRGDTAGALISGSYYRGQTLSITGCVLYAGASTNSAYQGLTNVTVECKIGDTSTANTYTGVVDTASTPNKWSLMLTAFPTNWTTPSLQIKITDSGNNSYVYPLRAWSTKATL